MKHDKLLTIIVNINLRNILSH